MSNFELEQDKGLLVASHGQGPESGLWLWRQGQGGWQGQLIGAAHNLSSLAVHPALPMVYATAGAGSDEGRLHAWRVTGDQGERVFDLPSGGVEPAHLAIDPGGRVLIVANYQSGTLASWVLGPDGGISGAPRTCQLTGSGPDPERQESAHPHQILFRDDGVVVVIDLGADCLYEFQLDPETAALTLLREVPLPAGSGPRHGVFLPKGRMAIAGELGSTLLTGAGGEWQSTPATTLDRPGHARWERNYPGDIALGPEGLVHMANRSLCTLASFDVTGPMPQSVGEVETGVEWPQHLLVHGGHILVAGWDTGKVMAHPLREGRPGEATPLFDCAGACWLALLRAG